MTQNIGSRIAMDRTVKFIKKNREIITVEGAQYFVPRAQGVLEVIYIADNQMMTRLINMNDVTYIDEGGHLTMINNTFQKEDK